MNSLDGLQKAAAPDFFYTRLIGRMQQNEPVGKPFLLRPVFITAALAVVLIVNIISLAKMDKQPQQINKPATIESFAEAYNMNTATAYE
jgi:hypothetical protein